MEITHLMLNVYFPKKNNYFPKSDFTNEHENIMSNYTSPKLFSSCFSYNSGRALLQIVFLLLDLQLLFTLILQQFATMSFRRIQKLSETHRTSTLQLESDQLEPYGNKGHIFHFSQQKRSDPERSGTPNTRNIHQETLQPKDQSTKRKSSNSPKPHRYAKRTFEAKLIIAKHAYFQGEIFANELNKELQEFPKTQRISTKKENLNYQQLNIHPHAHNFTVMLAIGKGGFGKVWKVMEKQTRKIYAMKQMNKVRILSKKSVGSIMNERRLLVQLKHPFLVNMYCSFQDKEYLYLVMDYCNRGDLRYQLAKLKVFTEEETRFFLACVVLCLEYLHAKNIIHRDLKPQNLVMDDKGYVKVTDFGISCEVEARNFKDTSGTPGYMAPQVICRVNHSFGVDFYALGVIAFEFMTGKRPYIGADRQEIRHKILTHQVKLDSNHPSGWSRQSIDFINNLIQRQPEERLGFNGINEVKYHPFFNSIDWKLLEQGKLKSPFQSTNIEKDYSNYKKGIPDETPIEDIEGYEVLLQLQSSQQSFDGYDYNGSWRRQPKRMAGILPRRKVSIKY